MASAPPLHYCTLPLHCTCEKCACHSASLPIAASSHTAPGKEKNQNSDVGKRKVWDPAEGLWYEDRWSRKWAYATWISHFQLRHQPRTKPSCCTQISSSNLVGLRQQSLTAGFLLPFQSRETRNPFTNGLPIGYSRCDACSPCTEGLVLAHSRRVERRNKHFHLFLSLLLG